MLVRVWMSQDVITVSPNTSLLEAWEIMEEKQIRRLPVVKDGKLVGIITQGDIQRANPQGKTEDIWELDYLHPLAKITVAEAMTKQVLVVAPDDTIEEAALMMRKNKIGGLPVMENNNLVGIITESDIFDALIDVMGFKDGGIRIALALEDKPGTLLKALELIKEYYTNIISIATCRTRCLQPGKKEVVIRIEAHDVDKIIAELKKRRIKILDVRR